jgi:hypothetical protein
MHRRPFSLVPTGSLGVLVVTLACSSSSSSIDSAKAVCQRFLTCLSKVDPMTYATVQASYSPDSACWKSADAATSCGNACTTGLAPKLGTDPACACIADTDCTGGARCNTNSGACVACLSDADCANNALGTHCDPAAVPANGGTPAPSCVQCTSNAQCSGATPVCNADTCMVCAQNTDCPTGQLCAKKDGATYCTQ